MVPEMLNHRHDFDGGFHPGLPRLRHDGVLDLLDPVVDSVKEAS
jgi:hypothetical protein